jgi:hypothetical protein
VLPVDVYVRVARKLCSGLDMEVSYSTSAHVLLSVSKSIVYVCDFPSAWDSLVLAADTD